MLVVRSSGARTSLAVSVALTLTLWLAVDTALAAPPASGLALGAEAGPDYAQDPPGTFNPVALRLVEELLGRGAIGSYGAPVDAAGASPVVIVEPEPGSSAGSGGGEGGGGATPTPAPTPSPTPSGAPTPDPDPTIGLPTGELRVAIDADRHQAEQGEEIRYTIRVRNVGQTYVAGITLSSHVPEGTSYRYDDTCGGEVVGGWVTGQEDGVCANTDPVMPGSVEPGAHFSKTVGDLERDEEYTYWFVVQVDDDVADGTKIRNHAHVESASTGIDNSGIVTVRVV